MIRCETLPDTEPVDRQVVDISLLKQHLLIQPTLHTDFLLQQYARSAQQLFEHLTGWVCVATPFRANYAAPRCRTVPLPRQPVSEITLVQYRQADDTFADLDDGDYHLERSDSPGTHSFLVIDNLPHWRYGNPTLKVEFVAGYADPAAVPELIKQDILLMTADMHENRTSQVIGQTVNDLPIGWKLLVNHYGILP